MPKIGLGTLALKESEITKKAIINALNLGYRKIDTAQSYQNEKLVGEAIKESGFKREDLFITTKIKIKNMTNFGAISSFYESLKNLQTDYIDLLLIHHPYYDIYGAYKAMIELKRKGLVKAIGVCNFTPDRLEDFILHADELPQVMQFEIHPYNNQDLLMKMLKDHNILPEAHSPLAQGKLDLLVDSTISEIARKHNKSTAQIILKWDIQRNSSVVVKSSNITRLEENIDIFDFELTDEEMEKMNGLNKNQSSTPQMREPEWIEHMSNF